MRIHKFDLIIFDFDGVLVKFRWEWIYQGYLAILKSEGIDPNKYFTNSAEFRKWGSNNGPSNFKTLKIKDYDKAFKTYYDSYNRNIKILPYVEEFLSNLSNAGYTMAIVTNRHAWNTWFLLGDFSKYFVAIIGAEHVKKFKPDPEGINIVLRALGTKKKRTIIVGDSPFDIKAGKEAGIKTGAVVWEYGSHKLIDFKGTRPDYVIGSETSFYKLFL